MNASEARAIAYTFDEAALQKVFNGVMESIKLAAERNNLHIDFKRWVNSDVTLNYGEVLEEELIKRIKANGYEF